MAETHRVRDDPTTFTISTNVAGFKYHAVLIEPVWVPTRIVFDMRDEAQPTRASAEQENEVYTPAGIYGFHTVETRDKFCRRANAAADMDEHKVCVPITLRPDWLATMMEFSTGPVAKAEPTQHFPQPKEI